MGAQPYWYFTPYEADADAALQKLRQREFQAGRYYPAMDLFLFPLDPAEETPGAQHGSIEEAREEAMEEGTQSILDIDRVADAPDFCVAAPLEDEVLQTLYGTNRPTHEMVEGNMDFLENVERGHAVYFTIYRDGKPAEYFFAGYSFD